MITFDSTQQAIVSSPRKEDISWLFTVSTQGGQTYRWSTKAKSYGGQDYTFKIIPESFNGVRLNRSRSEAGLQAPNTCNFHVSNKDNTLRALDFRNASVLVDLVISNGTDERIIRSFRFAVLHCLPNYQRLEFSCQDFLQQYIRGSYPAGRLARDIFPSDDQDQPLEDITPPVPFGCAYPPLASVYATDDRYLLLGGSGFQYDLFAVHAPIDYPSQIERRSGMEGGLIHYLKLDEGAGVTAADSTMFGNDATLGGSSPAGYWMPSYAQIDNCYWFYLSVSTGANCGNPEPLASIGDPDACRIYRAQNQGFSVAFWMKGAGITSNERYVLYKYSDAANHIAIGRKPSGGVSDFRVSMGGGSGYYYDFSLLSAVWASLWNHITVNFELTGSAQWTVSVYVGGVFNGSHVFNVLSADLSNSGDLIWGGNGTSGACALLDECRIYNHPLTTDEMDVLAAYTEGDFYTFNQTTKTDSDGGSWRMCQPLISDRDNDGAADSQGHFYAARSFLPPPVMLARSDTWDKVNPAYVIACVLEDLGVNAANIDTGPGSTFEQAAAVYDEWGLEFHGAFFEKISSSQALAMLLNQCNSVLDVGEKVGLRVRSRTARAVVTKAHVIRQRKKPADQEQVAGEGTFKASAGTLSASDSGHVSWQRWGHPQDRALKTLVPAKSGKNSASGITLDMPFVHDSQQIQRLGSLVFQRLFLLDSYRFFESKLNLLALQPDDVVRINEADYGGCYTALVDSMEINRQGFLDLSVITFAGETKSIRSSWYRWTASGAGIIEFYCELAAGGDPGLNEPDLVLMNGMSRLKTNPGSLTDYTWGYGDNDSLGYDTVYVRLTQSEVVGGYLYIGGDPDARPSGYIKAEYALDDYGDLFPDPVDVEEDGTNDFEIWKPATSGPSGIEVVQNLWAGMADKFCLTVSPAANQAQFQSIEAALAQVPSDGARIWLKNGTYTHTGSITVPNKPILIEGESQGGVVLQNHAGDDLFVLHNPTALMAFKNFSIASQNTSVYSKMFNIYGDTAAQNTSNILLQSIKCSLADAGTYQGNGDYGVYHNLCDGIFKLADCVMTGGKYPVYIYDVDRVEVSSTDISLATYMGIYVFSNKYSIFSNNISGFYYIGIGCGGSGYSENSVVSSNKIESKDIAQAQGQTGIYCSGLHGSVSDNTIILTNIPATAGTYSMEGIFLGDINKIVKGNTIKIYAKASVLAGIFMTTSSTASENQIVFDNNGITAATKNGIYIPCSQTIVMANQIDGTDGDVTDCGIFLTSAAHNNFVVNNIMSNVGTTVDNTSGGTGNTTSPNKGV